MAVTSDALYTGNPLNIFKGQKGLILIRDYNPDQIKPDFTPFDSATGLFDSTLKSEQGYQCLGEFDENGIEFDPSVTVADVMAWQSPDKQRSDVTQRTMLGTFTCIEQRPIIDRINNLLPISGAGAVGQAGYRVLPDSSPTIYEYDAIFIGVDNKYGIVSRVYWFPRCQMTKQDKASWARKNETQTKLVLEALYDPHLFAPYAIFVDGPGWRRLGGETPAPGGDVAPVAAAGNSSGSATLSFAEPAAGNGPFTYVVFVDDSNEPVPAGNVAIASQGEQVTASLTGIPAGEHAFKVSASGANLSTSAKSKASNKITVA